MESKVKKKNRKRLLGLCVISSVLFFNFMTIEASAEEKSTYYEQRSKVLEGEGYKSQQTFPIITKNVTEGAKNPYQQKISFSPMKESGEMYSVDDILGDGTTENASHLAVNIFSDFSNGFSSATEGGFSASVKSSGLSVIAGEDDKLSVSPLSFNPKKIKFYSSISSDGTEEIKFLSEAKAMDKDIVTDYIVEFSLKSYADKNEVDVTATLTNLSGINEKIGLMYTADIETKNPISNDDPAQFLQTAGENRGIYVTTGHRDPTHRIRTKLMFPPENEDGPKNWTVVDTLVDEPDETDPETPSAGKEDDSALSDLSAFNRGKGTSVNEMNGLEAGYNESEVKVSTSKERIVNEPFQEGESVGSPHKNTVQLKTKTQVLAENESVTLKWSMSNAEEKLRAIEAGDYREMDRKSGIDVTDESQYTKMNFIPPLKVDDSSYDGLSNVENYVVFGKANPKKDSLDVLKSGKPSDTSANRKTNLNFSYELENQTKKKTGLGLIFPRIITYKKQGGYINSKSNYFHSYSSNYQPNGNGDFLSRSTTEGEEFTSGFGLATFKDSKVDIPTSIPSQTNKAGDDRNNFVEEAFISQDGKTVLVYGKYKLGKTFLPVRVMVKNIGTGGKIQVTFEYLNKVGEINPEEKTEIGAYYAVNFDINGRSSTGKNAQRSIIRTLGSMDGVYFLETKDMDGVDVDPYYVAHYTSSPPEGTSPVNIVISDLREFYPAPGHTYFQPNPLNWRNPGRLRDEYLKPFDESEKKGDEIHFRNFNTGKVVPGKMVDSPMMTFVYDNQALGVNEMGRADFEIRVSDMEEVEYSPVTISSHPVEWNAEGTSLYNPIFTQRLDASTAEPKYLPKELILKTKTPSYVKVTKDDFKVFGSANQEIDSSLYDLTVGQVEDEASGESYYETQLVIKDPVSLAQSTELVTVKQNSVVDNQAEQLLSTYRKDTRQFWVPIKATNAWKIEKTPLQGDPTINLVESDNERKSVQMIDYEANFSAVSKNGLSVGLNSDAGDASKYIDVSYQPDFTSDDVLVTYKDGQIPTFNELGSTNFIVIVESRQFGQPIEVPVTVNVTNEVKMTIKRQLESGEPLHDLTQPNLPLIEDKEEPVEASIDFEELLQKNQEAIFEGYTFSQRVIKINEQVITDTANVPSENFVVEYIYKGTVSMEPPGSFDFGENKLHLTTTEGVQPKVTKKGNAQELMDSLQIINTQGEKGWKLTAHQSKLMMNGTKPFSGKMYYIPESGKQPIEIGNQSTVIESNNGKIDIINQVPLLPRASGGKVGIFIDILPGNKTGDYKDGEITWNLENAL